VKCRKDKDKVDFPFRKIEINSTTKFTQINQCLANTLMELELDPSNSMAIGLIVRDKQNVSVYLYCRANISIKKVFICHIIARWKIFNL